MNVTDFKTSGYFPWTVLLLGFTLVPIGIAVAANKSIMVGLFILLVSLTILTTHYRIKVDFKSKVFYDYLWILGMKFGDKGSFETIDCLIIWKTNVSQTMNHLAGSSTLRKEVFEGYLKFSPGESIHLTTKDHKTSLLRQLKPIAVKLNTKIVDYSEGSAREI